MKTAQKMIAIASSLNAQIRQSKKEGLYYLDSYTNGGMVTEKFKVGALEMLSILVARQQVLTLA